MFQVFADADLQKSYERKGYVILRGLLPGKEVKELKELALANSSQFVQPFHASHFSNDVTYKMQVHQVLNEVVFGSVKPHLANFRPVFGNFMVKKPGEGGFLQMHADWAYVEEPQMRSMAVWVPLVDTNEQNGCLGVIEGSHRFMNSVRGPRIQQNNFEHDRQWVKDYGTLLPVNAGDGIVYDHALLHFSQANMSGELRPALNVSTVPANAPMIHYCVPEGQSEIMKYTVPSDDFFIHYNNFQTPELGEVIGKLPMSHIKYIDSKMKWLGFRRLCEKVFPPLQHRVYL